MDVLDRLQSGLFFQPNLVDLTPTISQPSLLPNQAHPTSHYHNHASSSTPAASFAPINSSTPEVPFPLLSVSADVDVHGRLALQRYVFPIYDGSVVTSFRCWIGNDKLLEGAVKAKEVARADFKHAVSQHKVAVLVEELAPEVFETSVGNIPAQTTVKIEITYANLLKVDKSTGGLVLTIPTSIAPRYGDAPAGYSGNKSLLTEGLRISVQASMLAAIRKMESRSHPISVEMGAVSHKSFKNFAAGASSDMLDYSKGRATLSDRKAELHQDFVLQILCSSRESSQSQAIAASQPGQQGLSTIAVTVHPGDLFCQDVNMEDFVGEIIFVTDRSGSMKSKIPSLNNVMNIFLRSLPEACSFNIASFGSQVTWLWPSSMRYSQENLDVASKHVDSFQANYGGTEIYGALHSVLDHYNKRNDVPTSVILLTDGEVWNVDNVIQLVRRTASNGYSNIRFFSLGIGDQVSHRLVEGIGQQGGGYAEVVPESSMGSWQERVIQMLKSALTPSRLQCNVDLGEDLATKTSERQIAGYSVQYPEWIQAPHHIPVLNTFSHFSVYYMLERGLDSLPKLIKITATTERGEKLTAQLPIQTVAEQPTIHHLAAKALMNDYETGQSWMHSLNPAFKSSNPAGFEKVLEQKAQHIRQTWSIPSKWTSYVAIDRTTAQQHAISIHKADAMELSQLTRPRHTFTFTRRLISRKQGGSLQGSHNIHASPEEAFVDDVEPRVQSVHSHPYSSSFDRWDAHKHILSLPLPPPPPRSLPPPDSFDSIEPCVYKPGHNTFGAGVGIPGFDLSTRQSQTQDQHHDESRVSPVLQGNSQPAELRPIERTASVRNSRASSHLTQPRGREDEAAATFNDLSEDKDKELYCIHLSPEKLFVNLASEVQVSQGAIVDDVQPGVQSVHSRLGDATIIGRPKTDLHGAHDDSPHSPTDSPKDTSSSGSCRARSDRELRFPDRPGLSDLPRLEKILRLQQADGRFCSASCSLFSFLEQRYINRVINNFLDSNFNGESPATRGRLSELAYNIGLVVYGESPAMRGRLSELAHNIGLVVFNGESPATRTRLSELAQNIALVVYINHEYAASKALFELQVAKARQWIKRMIIELLKESGDSEETLGTPLEELAESMVEKMEKLVLRMVR
ncbi:von Willebrand factor type A domain protein [Aspergillus udagawae]|nr:von Willebrand factor type A domain protein [Aspergillus udagawae]